MRKCNYSARMEKADISARIPADLKAAAQQAAIADHRSLASLIRKLLEDHLRRQPAKETTHV
jgi:hypothetical protein